MQRKRPRAMNLAAKIAGLCFLVIIASDVCAAPIVAQPEIVGAASVIDGDTIEIHGQRIRLHGIDAPESSQECLSSNRTPWRCGQRAALVLAERIANVSIRCRPSDRDRYGRIIATCLNGSEDISKWMVANGWAVAFRRFSLDYAQDEEQARRARRGLWEGSFEMPWDWRARRRER